MLPRHVLHVNESSPMRKSIYLPTYECIGMFSSGFIPTSKTLYPNRHTSLPKLLMHPPCCLTAGLSPSLPSIQVCGRTMECPSQLHAALHGPHAPGFRRIQGTASATCSELLFPAASLPFAHPHHTAANFVGVLRVFSISLTVPWQGSRS